MKNSKTTLIILILTVCAVFFGVKYFVAQRELIKTNSVLGIQNINGKILEFTKLFIEKVLKAEKEIDFETRLKLENAVRNLGEEKILSQWQKFTESKTEAQAQVEVKNLLEMLVGEIKIK